MRAIADIAAICLLAACASPDGGPSGKIATKAVKAPLSEVRAATILPAKFATTLENRQNGPKIRIPAAMLRISSVARPRAELRAGPGVQFDLEDFVLPHGTPVLVFDRVGVWQKVVTLDLKKHGWVHYQALGATKPTAEAVTIDERILPTTLATKAIGSAAAYPAKEDLIVAIPKGAMFRALSFEGSDALVMLPETNSVMWVSRKDMR